MDMIELATQWGRILQQQNKMCTTAESCTGGGVAAAITAIAGSSQWFERGFVTYSNAAKQELLQVPADILQAYGAVSEETAKAMALGALQQSHADVSVAVTGIAGPDGGTKDKPVGTIWFAWGLSPTQIVAEKCFFAGERAAIRQQCVMHALSRWLQLIKNH